MRSDRAIYYYTSGYIYIIILYLFAAYRTELILILYMNVILCIVFHF